MKVGSILSLGFFPLFGGYFLSGGRGDGEGGGFQKSVVYQNFPPPKKKITYENCTAPLAKTIFKMHSLQPLVDQVFVFILGH